jgi:AmpE protein
MKLLVIVLCLLSERFLVHASSHNRFQWFASYGNAMEQRLSNIPFLSSSWLMLIVAALPMLLVAFLAVYFFSNWLFGFVGLLLNICIFYCCIGPGNPFYPVRVSTDEHASHDEIKTYLVRSNEQLFAVLFWYIFLGPVAVLAYRLISLSQSQKAVKRQAIWLTEILDWLPARMTVLFFLIVGNFQAGWRHFSKLFFAAPGTNQSLIGDCGLQALGCLGDEPVDMSQAENLMEHAIIALLVLLACFTLVAWV